MRNVNLLFFFILFISCSDSPTTSDIDKNNLPIDEIELNIEVKRDIYYSDYHNAALISVTNTSSDTVYLNVKEFLIQKKIQNEWIEETSLTSYNYFNAYPPGRSETISVLFSSLVSSQFDSELNGEYRAKILICNIKTEQACPETVSLDKVITSTFTLKNKDISYEEIEPRLSNLNNSFFISDSVLSFSNDNQIQTTITNNADFSVYLSSNIVQYEKYIDGEWKSGVSGISNEGYWYTIDGLPHRYTLDSEETFTGIGGDYPELELSELNGTIGTFRFKYDICLEMYSQGVCPTPIPDEYISAKVSDTFRTTD